MTQSIKEIAGDKYILWGANWSLYTAKVRPYLIKKDVEYVEVCPSHPHWDDHVQMGAAIKRVALLDDVSHHLRFLSLVDEMNAAEKETRTEILQSIGAQDLTNVKLKRNMKREDYTSVLA